jgi:hypothetical protein
MTREEKAALVARYIVVSAAAHSQQRHILLSTLDPVKRARFNLTAMPAAMRWTEAALLAGGTVVWQPYEDGCGVSNDINSKMSFALEMPYYLQRLRARAREARGVRKTPRTAPSRCYGA